MAESLGSLGANRKPLLNELREVDSGRKSAVAVDTQLGRLDDSQLRTLARFVEQGGWRGELGESTLRVLGERISARRGVSTVYENRTAQSPISDVVPQQAAEALPVAEEAVIGVAVSSDVRAVQSASPRPGYRVVDLRTPRAPVNEPARAPVRPPVQPAVHERREPLSQPRVAVSRGSSRPAEGRGSRF